MSLHAENLIDGCWQLAQSGGSAPSIDPSNQATIGTYSLSGVADADGAIAAARRAFDRSEWAQNPRLRQIVMLRWADLMERRADNLARLLTLENGKPLAQSRGEIAGSYLKSATTPGLRVTFPVTSSKPNRGLSEHC
jgi:betaine-aldehyde dehydrogenase